MNAGQPLLTNGTPPDGWRAPTAPCHPPEWEDSLGRVLVVDDEPANRLLLHDLLEARGFEVIEAANGEEALAAMASQPDAVLLDVMMPRIDGLEVCRRLKADPRTASVPVLMITSLTDRADRIASIAVGANDFLNKPIDMQDLYLRVRNAVQLNRATRKLEELIELKNRFIGMAAHDLRNPLGVILSYSELMASRDLSPEQIEIGLECIGTSSSYMLRLVNDLLEFARIESGQLTLHAEPIDLGDLVRRAAALDSVLAEQKGVRLVLQIAPNLPSVNADSAKIEQVLHNLVGNAVKYSKVGSTVEVHLASDDESVTLAVSDSGPGIPRHEQGRIFEPFYMTSARPTNGEPRSGLGLAIVKRIVDGHGGDLWVDSEPGQGSTFYVSLPVRVESRVPVAV